MLHKYKQKAATLFLSIIALTAWTAIIFQAYLTTGSFGNLFSYFTILTNLLIAICSTANVVFYKTNKGKFFKSPTVQTAIALYIFIVALVYNTVLRGLITLNGWSIFVDTLLHVVVPVLYLLFWAFFVPKGTLLYRQSFRWLVFPFIYLVYSLVRGSVYHWYPYPFLNVLENGYQQVFLNASVLLLVFLISGLALIKLDKFLGKYFINKN